MINNATKSDLAKIKALGSAHTGVHHWWQQRLTAIFLAVLTIWLTTFIAQIVNARELSIVLSIIQKPQNVLMLILLTALVFYHAALGMQVVIEDYIKCRFSKLALIVLVQAFSVVTTAAFAIAAIYTMTL